jgi:hypothetical protein
LNRIDDNDHYECLQCGETYDLKGINSMELDLESFDKLLLYTLKNYKSKSYKKLRR